MDTLPSPLPPAVSETITSAFTLIPTGTSLADFNNDYLAKHKDSALHILSALSVRQTLDPTSKAQNEKQVPEILDMEQAGLEDALEGLNVLKSWGCEESALAAYREKAAKRWGESSAFKA